MEQLFWNVGVSHFLMVAAALFGVGVIGVLLRRNALIVLISVELMLNAANLSVLAFARQWHDTRGQALAMIVIAVAAAEAAVGLAIVVKVFRATRNINVDRLTSLKH